MKTKIIEKLEQHLENTGWDVISNYLYTPNFDKILSFLIKEVEEERRFSPPIKDLFNAHHNTHFDDIKVIFIAQDPYPQVGVADGIAFSCSKTMKEQPSLRFIFNALSENNPSYDRNCDLSRWSKQGVLMLNTALTVQINKIGSHVSLWYDFNKAVLSHINEHHKNIPVVLLGKKAEVWDKYLLNQKLFKVAHPAAAAYSGGVWKHNNVFGKINEHLIQDGKKPILW